MKATNLDLNPCAMRKANGWCAVIEFPNGGRQVFSSLHGTMDAAIREADHALRLRLKYPEGTVRDPGPHEYMDLANARI